MLGGKEIQFLVLCQITVIQKKFGKTTVLTFEICHFRKFFNEK